MDDSNATLPIVNHIPPHKLECISIHPQEVEDILKHLNQEKLQVRTLLSLLDPYLSPLLTSSTFILLKAKFQTSENWQLLLLFSKKNDPSDVSNYRPISLLNTLAKVFEKIVHKYVFNFLNDHHVITTLQSGFFQEILQITS